MIVKAEKIKRNYIRKSGHTNILAAVQETDFLLEPGKLIAVIGRSGSGKSTLLNMLAGLLAPTAGKVFFDSTDIYSLTDGERSLFRNRHIGIIPQGQSGLKSLTVEENILLPCTMYGKGAERLGAGQDLMRILGILSLKDVYPDELSGGEMRRLAIARALIMDPDVILADEPTGDLDDMNTRTVLDMLRHRADSGAAVLLVTHDRESVQYAESVFRMDNGILVS